MKKLIGLITLIASVVIATALNLQYLAQKKEKLRNSMAADRRFIDVAADAYFLEKKSEEAVTLETLVEWSIAREGKNNCIGSHARLYRIAITHGGLSRRSS